MNFSSRPPLCFLYNLIRLGLNNPWKPCEESLGNEGDKWRKLAFNLKLFYATCNYTLTIASAVDRAEQEPITRLLNPRTSNCRLSGQRLTNWAKILSRDQPVLYTYSWELLPLMLGKTRCGLNRQRWNMFKIETSAMNWKNYCTSLKVHETIDDDDYYYFHFPQKAT